MSTKNKVLEKEKNNGWLPGFLAGIAFGAFLFFVTIMLIRINSPL